jgi:hypothetical protein
MNLLEPGLPRVLPIGLAVLAALLVTPLGAQAQPSATVSLGRSFNSFNEASAAESGRSVEAGIEADHRAADGRLRLFYSLDAGTYTTPGDWGYYLNTTGATWRFGKKAEDGKPAPPATYVGGSLSWRSNGASWAAADYFALAAFANMERHPSATSAVRFGYRLDMRNFPDLSQLDQLENVGFGSVLVNFQSKTTLIGEVHAGAKNYRGGLMLVEVPITTDPGMTTVPMGRMGKGVGPSLRTSMTVAEQTPGELSGQVTLLGRIAQSLGDRMGSSFQYVRRTSFGGLPAAVVTTPALFFEDGIYDDPYASNADYLRGSVKYVRPSGLEVEAAGAWLGKDYRGMQALNLDGAPLSGDLREDRIWRAGLAWSIPLFPSKTGPVGLNLDVDYWYTDHQSNDLYYNYRSHVVGIGVTVKY